MLSSKLICFALVVIIHTTWSLPDGAPTSTCNSLLPIHQGIPPESIQATFRVEPQASVVGQGQILRVEIPSDIPQLAFKGFMIHARTRDGRIVGRFETSSDGLTRLIDCETPQDTATHANTQPKINYGLDWVAPTDYLGDIIFNSTIAQDFDKFWVGETSQVVKVVPSNEAPTNSGISTTRKPIAATTPNFYRPTSASARDDEKLYEGCGDTKTCFGSPDNCVETKTCETFSAVIVKGDRYIFELKSKSNAGYVALGLSDDDKMGRDSVVECVKESGTIKAYTSWTVVGPGKYDSPRTGVPQNIINLIEGRIENGEIYCQVERKTVSEVNGVKFDLANKNYFLLLVSGEKIRPSTVDYHDVAKVASVRALRLSEVANVAGKSKLLIRLHGAFMIVAWIGTASLGIIFARYFKQTWVGSSLCGKDLWFAWHRFFMIITWGLTVAGFVIIFVELRGWSMVDNPHAILGTITTLICFFQPIGAFFRPHPGSKRRPMFNWSHWLGGNVAHILALVTIFFAVKLGKAELPEWMDWILVAFVVFHVISHLLFTTLGCMSDRKGTQRVSAFPMTDINHSRSQILANSKQDEVFSGFRKLYIAIYIFVIAIIVLALLAVVIFAPIEATLESLKMP